MPVTGAAMVAQKEMAAFLSKLRTDIHWATLRAAIRRNGAYWARRVQIHDFRSLRGLHRFEWRDSPKNSEGRRTTPRTKEVLKEV